MTPRDEDGLTLIELMVAVFVLAIVSAGLASVTISALQVTRINTDRTVGTNLAQAEVERLRTLDFVELEALLGGTEPVVRGTDEGDYSVQLDVQWAALDSDTDPCSEAVGSTDRAVLRVDVAVWPGAGPPDGGQVARTSTQIARPPTTPSGGAGALAVKVADHQDPPQGTHLVLVSVRGPQPQLALVTQTTPASGCVLFTDLEPGSYDVEVRRPGHVSIRPGPDEAAPVRPVEVTPEVRTVLEVAYAPQATARLLTAPSGAGPTVVPAALPVSLGRDGRVTTGALGTERAPLWPGRWEAWVGDCPAADPAALLATGGDDGGAGVPRWPGAQRDDAVVLVAGQVTEVVAAHPTVRFNLTPPPGSAGAPAPTTITATSLEDCADDTAQLVFPGTYVPGGQPWSLGLPYGTWRLEATSGDGVARVDVEVSPTAPGPFTPTGAPTWSLS